VKPFRLAASAAALVALFAFASPASAEERRAASAGPPRHATQGEPYVFGQLGLFDPAGDSGYYAGGGIGSRVTDMIAIDLGLSTYRGHDHGADMRVWPLLAGVRFILPNPVVEPYLGLGAGFYFVDPEHAGSKTTFGGHASLGVDAWLTPRAAVNGEFRYHFADARIDGVTYDADGASFSLGVKVGF
jgi:hypothetical protein